MASAAVSVKNVLIWVKILSHRLQIALHASVKKFIMRGIRL